MERQDSDTRGTTRDGIGFQSLRMVDEADNDHCTQRVPRLPPREPKHVNKEGCTSSHRADVSNIDGIYYSWQGWSVGPTENVSTSAGRQL